MDTGFRYLVQVADEGKSGWAYLMMMNNFNVLKSHLLKVTHLEGALIRADR